MDVFSHLSAKKTSYVLRTEWTTKMTQAASSFNIHSVGWVHGQYIQTGKQPADTLGSREGRDDATLLSPWLLAYNYRGLPSQVIRAISDRGLPNRAMVIHNW